MVHSLEHAEATGEDSNAAPSPSKYLYVASYLGSVTSLSLAKQIQRRSSGDGVPSLKPVASTEGCAGSPSWLMFDSTNKVLYCTDEGLSSADDEGSISSFRAISDGSLVRLDRVRTISGPVSAILYGTHGNGLAVAHYGGSALTSWNVQDPVNIQSVETKLFELAQPGPDPSRQEASHPHAAVVEPNGRFLLVPDLGADFIRVYAISDGDLGLEERQPLTVTPGSGPRHIAFAIRGKKTFMYLVTELGNTIVGYEVVYGKDGISFTEVWTSGIHGKGKSVPKGAAASEITVSPDSRFLVLSSRNENSLKIPNLNPKNSTQITSDPLINFSIDGDTGHLDLLQELPCGGRFPRHFSVNKDGNLVAVALQHDGRVVLFERNVDTGIIGDIVAYADVEGEVTAAIFNE
ncbi:Lactonase, 7-bladed beta-propeller-domain-containing protein [Mariannaea sp. PMI_226]|nr:Lactonase, 7-bladed beta-propeller-domain-containing protein [Mariannaea sp. PMI_226]